MEALGNTPEQHLPSFRRRAEKIRAGSWCVLRICSPVVLSRVDKSVETDDVHSDSTDDRSEAETWAWLRALFA